ncbi:MAG: sigma-70 family RNA polymerase sigma factor [Ignavibacteriae bacterium]|nr:sigma-70 family RNA polymerase sigma factor [Ignavibacteriota bacterium]MCB9214868.1 sigma-70 family RNA polymerase sigma factor [Ignavibacteria bacterium]
MPDTRENITQLLVDLGQGDERAVDQLLPLVYNELRRMAHHFMVKERSEHTLNTTALVHEAYLKLIDQREVTWQNRSHFFAIASIAMRRILVNYAKMRSREKRGGGGTPISLGEVPELQIIAEERAEELIALDEALDQLAEINERAGRVVECRFFGGLSIEETAEALGVSPMTVKRDWRFAKAWLKREIGES